MKSALSKKKTSFRHNTKAVLSNKTIPHMLPTKDNPIIKWNLMILEQVKKISCYKNLIFHAIIWKGGIVPPF